LLSVSGLAVFPVNDKNLKHSWIFCMLAFRTNTQVLAVPCKYWHNLLNAIIISGNLISLSSECGKVLQELYIQPGSY
jgi:hypothetical protein